MIYHGVTIPTGLSPEGERAAKTIVGLLVVDGIPLRDLTFHHPREWDGEYGVQSELILVYEGSMAQPYFEYDYMCYEHIERMRLLLETQGVYTEACTSYYSAVYSMD